MNYFFEDIKEFHVSKEIFVLIENMISDQKKKKGEINFIFCSDPYILKLNKDYLEHDYYTDVITFDYCENDVISGDVFIGTETVKDNAKNFEESFENELHRVMIHGVLHLLGYNDKTDGEQEEMTILEDFYLKKLYE